MNFHILDTYVCLINMASNCQKHITLDFNCGYARTAVRELTPKRRWKSATYATERASKFKDLFGAHEKYGIQQSYFEVSDNKPSQFNQDCEKILQIWSKRWNPSSTRQDYEDTFSIQKWKNYPWNSSSSTPCKPVRPARGITRICS